MRACRFSLPPILFFLSLPLLLLLLFLLFLRLLLLLLVLLRLLLLLSNLLGTVDVTVGPIELVDVE